MNEGLFGIHGAALTLRSERMGVIASNIANAATPGYKARDIDFNAALDARISAERGGASDPRAGMVGFCSRAGSGSPDAAAISRSSSSGSGRPWS